MHWVTTVLPAQYILLNIHVQQAPGIQIGQTSSSHQDVKRVRREKLAGQVLDILANLFGIAILVTTALLERHMKKIMTVLQALTRQVSPFLTSLSAGHVIQGLGVLVGKLLHLGHVHRDIIVRPGHVTLSSFPALQAHSRTKATSLTSTNANLAIPAISVSMAAILQNLAIPAHFQDTSLLNRLVANLDRLFQSVRRAPPDLFATILA